MSNKITKEETIGRHNTAVKIANKLWWKLLFDNSIEELAIWLEYIEKLNTIGFFDKYPEEEAERIFRDAEKHVKEEMAKTPLKPDTFTDNGHAKAFKKAYGQYFCCSGAKGESIYFYDGVKWCGDSDQKLFKYFQKLAEEQSREAANIGNDKSYNKHALSYQNSRKIADAIKALKNKILVEQSIFDSDPYVLNTPEFLYNLKTGKRREHKPEDYCTKVTGCNFSEEGKEIFENYLDNLTDHDKELQDYLQIILGIAAIGEPTKAFLFFSERGGTGKSTFILLLAEVLGDYAKPINPNLITNEMNDGDKSDSLSHLECARFAHASELKEDKTLDPQGVKKIASVDPIVCRQKYKTQYVFNPTHTAVIATNNIPESFKKDEAVMDRLVIVPFKKRFRYTSEDIPNYNKKLFTECGGYVLKWIIEGAKKYISDPKIINDLPKAVKDATNEYWEKSDIIQEFIDECCDTTPEIDKNTGEIKDLKIRASVLYNSYLDFCKNNKIPGLRNNKFYKELEIKGYHKKREADNNYIIGIRLKNYRESYNYAYCQTDTDITKPDAEKNTLIN